MKICPISLFIVIILFQSCNRCGHNLNGVANDLLKDYPELYGNGLINGYAFKRECYNRQDSLKMELFGDAYSENEIIVLSDSTGKMCAIPFPNNDNRSYWRFFGEKVNQSSAEKSFNSAMHKAFKSLALKEDWKKGIVFHDMMFSLIQARPILPIDSPIVKQTIKEYPDSCNTTIRNNSRATLDRIWGSSWIYLNTFKDFHNGRILQFNSDEPRRSQGFKIISYRNPCFVKPMPL